MTREAFIELLVERGHEAWQRKEQGWMVDLEVYLGRVNKQTNDEVDPLVNVRLRGKLTRSF